MTPTACMYSYLCGIKINLFSTEAKSNVCLLGEVSTKMYTPNLINKFM